VEEGTLCNFSKGRREMEGFFEKVTNAISIEVVDGNSIKNLN
jgi:hypothetical protein